MRITILRSTMAAFDNGCYTRLYEAGEEHEIGSVLMPESLANALAHGSVPPEPAFGRPGSSHKIILKSDGNHKNESEYCAKIDDKPVSDEWQRKNAETLNRILGNDKQLHSHNHLTSDYPA